MTSPALGGTVVLKAQIHAGGRGRGRRQAGKITRRGGGAGTGDDRMTLVGSPWSDVKVICGDIMAPSNFNTTSAGYFLRICGDLLLRLTGW